MKAQSAALKLKLFEQVAQRIGEAVASGALPPGARLPSVRQMSDQEGVSVSTVLMAYMQLEAEGIIEARPQSGHYVRHAPRDICPEPQMSKPPQSAAPVSVGAAVAKIYEAARDPQIVPLGAAVASPELLPTRRLGRILAALARNEPEAGVSYDMPPGFLSLRQQIARRSFGWGCALSADELVTTCGASEAVQLSLRAVAKPGDTVAVESPAYYGTLQAIEALGLKALEIATHPRHGMELSALDAALKRHKVAAVLVVTNFSNPMGACMPEERKRELVSLLARRSIPLIEDDVYGDLHFGSARPKVAKAFDKQGTVLLCGSVSKTIAPGFRVGWIAPGRFRERVELLKFSSSMATPTFSQMAIAEFLRSGGFDRHLRMLRRHLLIQVGKMAAAVKQHFPEGTRATRPEGGSVLWVELPERVSALELQRRALQARIIIAPGPLFSASQRFENFIRLNCAQLWTPALESAVATVGRLAHQLA
jgi:DNA-binding transcriptional MocR family regulator